MQIKQKTEIIRLMEKHYGGRIESLENQIDFFKQHTGLLLQQGGGFIQTINKLLDQNENIRTELSSLRDLVIKADPSDVDKKQAEELMKRMYEKEPGVFQIVNDTLLKVAIGAAGSAWGTFFIEFAKEFPR